MSNIRTRLNDCLDACVCVFLYLRIDVGTYLLFNTLESCLVLCSLFLHFSLSPSQNVFHGHGNDSIADIFGHHNENQQPPLLHSEFSIDAAHELARFIYDNVQVPEADELQAETVEEEDVKPVNTATTSSLNDSKSPDVTIHYRRASSDTATTKHQLHPHTQDDTVQPKANIPPAMEDDNTHPHHQYQHPRRRYDDGVDNTSDLRHPNEIIDEAGSKVLPLRRAKKKTKKIILKKAPYICPEANWETGNPMSYKACAMYARAESKSSALPESCVSIIRDGNKKQQHEDTHTDR